MRGVIVVDQAPHPAGEPRVNALEQLLGGVGVDLAPNPRPVHTDPLHCSHLLGQPPIAGAQQAHRVMAPVAPGWVSGIA